MSDDTDDLDTDDVFAAEWATAPALAALAEADARTPPSTVRTAVLGHAATSPLPAAEAMDPAGVYRARVAALRSTLAGLSPLDWNRPAAPYEWTVHGLLAHLLVIERYTGAQLGLCAAPDGNVLDHLGIGPSLIATELAADAQATAARWIDCAGAIVDHVSAPAFDLDGPLPLHGWPFRARTALIARAFELWTHTDDILHATGQARIAPAPAELRTMSSTSVAALPAALAVVAPGVAMGPTRVVLTGAGGGTFDLGGAPERRRALLAVDVVDYCRVIARRIDPDTLDCAIEGDGDLVRALLAASSILAV